jgi:hypothetical protein
MLYLDLILLLLFGGYVMVVSVVCYIMPGIISAKERPFDLKIWPYDFEGVWNSQNEFGVI